MTTFPHSRLPLWNSHLQMAWLAAKECHVIAHGKTTKVLALDGGTLPREQHAVLSALLLLTLAIEARANHLIVELVENGIITAEEGDAAQRLAPKHKWFLLPAIARRPKLLRADQGPHQAVAQICQWRNRLMHVKYEQLRELPSASDLASYFKRFAEAIADMNVCLGRTTGIDNDIVNIGIFD